jgi:hypothetical protein
MFVKLTESDSKNEFYIDVRGVRMITRNPKNLIETLLITHFQTAQGVQAIGILESPSEAARLVNAALASKDLTLS